MNQKGVVNIALVILVVVLAGTLGYVTLMKKPAQTEQPQSTQNVQPTPSGATNNPPATTPEPVATVNDQEQKNLESCFTYGDALAATSVNKSSWKTFEGFGFAIKYPTKSIAIKSVGNPYSGGDFSFEVSSLISPHEATISVYRLRNDIYRAKYYMNVPSVLYEPHSDTWWLDEYIWDSSKFVQCNPNPRGKTDDGKYSIYSASNADVGSFFINYFVVLRDIIKMRNYEPLVVQFGTGGDVNDPNYSSYPAFQSILENIVKTLELRPIKG